MNVAINGRFYAASVTGVQRVARELTRELLDLVDATVLVPRGVEAPCEIRRRARVIEGASRGHVWEQFELPMRARHLAADVMLHLGGTASRSRVFPSVTALYDLTPLTHPEWYTRRFRWWFRTAAVGGARHADRVLTLARATAREIHERLGVPRERIVIVRQGAAPFDASITASCAAERRAALGVRKPYVLAFGAGDPRKNLGFLREILRRWQTVDAGAPSLVVVGRMFPRVHAAVETGGSGGDVHVIGAVEDAALHALYAGALMLCFPSLAEGFGRPPLEAMACGTPVIVADYPAAREACGDHAAILPLDVERWLTAMRDAARDHRNDRCARMAWARRFTWRDGASDVVTALDGAAGRAGGGK